MALSLGRMTVLSGLGEPLRAEIELPDITADEASSLQPAVAPAEAFRAAGLEYNTALTDLRIVLQRRADGKSILRLSSSRSVSDPFIDLILQVSWSSGRIVRDYTILLDPPVQRQAQAAATAAQITAPATVTPAAAPTAGAVASAAAPAPAAPARTAAPKPAANPKPPVSDATTAVVKAGDTASKIASAHKPTSVSLDQMLVAMLRANPNAFISGNVNRIKAGAVLSLPDATQAGVTPPVEATQIINAQSRDFNAFRNKLATNVPAVQMAEPDRKASGKVQAEVDEKKPAAATPDKLTLSKGALKSKPDEDKIARDKADQEAAARVAELAKNINELNKLGASTATPPAKVASAAKEPVVEIPTIPVAVPAAPVASASAEPAASAPIAAASGALAPASEPATPIAAPASAASAPPTPALEESGDWMDALRENPLVLAGAGLAALLGGFGLYRARRRKHASTADSSFLESRLQADSFFGASGGQRVDTHSDDAPASSMSYSPSQLDATSDVDPVAEADVYLAYGRDLQAEEILKEALRASPQRIAIHSKLLEIYAKRRDAVNFAGLAAIVQALTNGQGAEWERIAAMGHGLEPGNSLYKSAEQNAAATATASPAWMDSVRVETPVDVPMSSVSTEPPLEAPAGLEGLDLDLDLDFLDSDLQAQDISAPPSDPITALTMPAALDIPDSTNEAPFSGLDFDLDLSTAGSPLSESAATAPPPPIAENSHGNIEFDLGSLSLDLEDPQPAAVAESADIGIDEGDIEEGDPLATKLSLAEEFNSIGDEDGARALAEEVLEEATGALRTKAQKFLDSLS